ncbi:CDC45 family [Phakopsora pachyrhizi]|uniref:CDC45 family n=1 Tax=Phakopsora pachyrhizi TaxID=170000 RepID=A0AAV0B8M3_PHAPC|nr:CDC45 family [Phakopsora pachyrhizi]
MYIKPNRYGHVYDSIIKNARTAQSQGTSTCPLLLIASMDIDALCGCKMLQHLLKQDSIKHRVIPVSGWKDLSKVSEQVRDPNSGYMEVILLNLGAQVDMMDFFELPPGVRLHIIDSHRPYSLENLFQSSSDWAGEDQEEAEDSSEVIVWDDGHVDDNLQAEKDAFQALRYIPERDSQGSEDESSEDELGMGIRRRGFDDEDEEEAEVNSDDQSSTGQKRRKGIAENKDRGFSKREINRFKSRLQKYYDGGANFGQSVASQLYLLVTLKGCEDNDLLWLAIIGLTYQFTSSLIDRDTYDAQVTLYQREVERINLIPQVSTVSRTSQIKLLGPDDRNIRLSDELRFTLFRHWNLYDSMFHSSYVAGKLKLWREKGRKNLQGLFAKMGFSLLQCQQNYTHMDMDLKRSLREKVEAIAPEYGLFELSFPSFVRAYGYQSVLSASDCVECVSAILEVATGVKLDFHSLHGGTLTGALEDGNQGGTLWDRGKGVRRWTEADERLRIREDSPGNHDQPSGNPEFSAQKTDSGLQRPKQDVWWVQNFWMACDALSTDPAFLRCALPLSMALHKSVIRQGTSMIDKQAIKTLRSFRLAVIKDGPDLHVFSHPATLTRLGMWLVDAVRDLIGPLKSNSLGANQKKHPKSFPFVIASLDDARDCYLVVGVNGALQYGDVRKNKFGTAFQEAAEVSGARARHDRFEECVVEVRKDDLMNFVQKIHLSL